MVTVLKHRIALAVLVGVLVIPVLTTNNAGLSHLLFCEAAVAQPFAVGSGQDDTGPEVTSSTQVSRDDPTTSFTGKEAVTAVCEGVRAEVSAQPISDDRLRLTVTIHNDSDLPWRGSVGLAAEGEQGTADLTAALGEVAPGDAASTSLELRILPGRTDLAGTLLLGP